MIRHKAALVFAASWLAACLQCGSSTPARPVRVPSSAFWCGGADGGAFVEVNALGKGRYQGTLYTEAGDIWFQGES